ncbi:sulfotransferase domain-containing protein [Parvularcula sp. IMCC14364]|uniref:sulfotransferase domain-containing protein n=1 Tax=Parvularcula sp. IMCC14364 TaxID=3067902 RepID=UPI002741D227|nr:sulfotransferase domain-containing protein [Parvularcula sp. IMCC14364]
MNDLKKTRAIEKKKSDFMSCYPKLNGKTMIMGVGAPRAGTSWLFQFLRTYDEIACSPIKEVHYFDTRYVPHLSGDWNRDFELATAEALLAKPHSVHGGKSRLRRIKAYREALIDRVRMDYCPEGYLDHFDRLCGSDQKYLCEITPAYMMLQADHFRKVEALFSAHDIKLKIIFLMRDPASRHWSQLKYQQARGKIEDARAELEKSFESSVLYERTRYDKTITELEKAFPANMLFYGFYENLFSSETVAAIQKFLGLPAKPASFDQVINRSVKTKSIDENSFGRLRDHYAEVYDFCQSRFGDRLPEEWRD